MPENTTVGDVIAAYLEACGLTTAFGVISIHNMPILDAIARRGRIRFVPARGEIGALNMADAYARVSGGLGVGITSTGVAAGNAAGSMVEALTAGSPVLHLTGQIESGYMDRARSYIHEAHKQPDMLKAVSKAYFRVWSPEQALGVIKEAIRTALTAPTGPVSVEIPIDIQGATCEMPADLSVLPIPAPEPSPHLLDHLAERVANARRPIFWLGGGARGAAEPARKLADMGVGVVTSVNGRGIVPEDHPMSLGAFNVSKPVEEFYATCDLMVAVGSRLRGNETLKYTLKLPQPLIQVDADPAMDGRSYPNALFIHGDSNAVLSGLAERLDGRLKTDNAFGGDLAAAKDAAIDDLRAGLGDAYAAIVDQLRAAYPEGGPWVRDITVSNSTWGNRYVDLGYPRQGVHSLGGAIGQGLPMAIGAALAAPDTKTVILSGDGGLIMNVGEFATAKQEAADITMILMNDGGYGVIRNIQDALYGGRQHYSDLTTPDFGHLCASLDIPRWLVQTPEAFGAAFDSALAVEGPSVVEIDMLALGPYARSFAGPPVRK
ncbi:MAG: thiamine pyrophosphate-binding protein [Bauldia litoralis]